MASNDYEFVTNWRIEGTVEEVFDVLDDPAQMARWWPAVYLETELLEPGDERRVGRVVRMLTKGWLPYTIRWRLTVTTSQRPDEFSIARRRRLRRRRRLDFPPGRIAGRRHLRLADQGRETAAALPLAGDEADLRRQPPLGDGARRGEPEAGAGPPPGDDSGRARSRPRPAPARPSRTTAGRGPRRGFR